MEENNLREKVTEHDSIIHKNLLPRVEALETFASGFTEKVSTLSNDVVRVQTGQAELGKGQKELEMTVKSENDKSREAIKEAKEATDETKKIANRLLDHVLEQDTKKKETDAEIRKTRWEIFGKAVVVLAGGSGLIALIIQAFVK